ncbi:GNAT family N-acetyltransferase [Halomonas sp. LS-001]
MRRTFSDHPVSVDDGVISCPSTLRREAILSLDAAHDPKSQSGLAQAIDLMLERPDADWQGLLIKPDGKQALSGATWVEVLSSKEANLWLPHMECNAAPELLNAAIGWASQQNLKVVKTVIAHDDPATAALLEESGFAQVVTLNYMSATTQAIPNATVTHAEFVHVKEAAPERLEAIFRQIERSSLDCPELQGVLTTQEALQGFYRQDIHAPEQWYLVRYQKEDAGLLLLAPHPEANNWELMYMGLAPTWRGHGLGRQVVNEALRKAKEAGMKEVILAVDQRNTPAQRLYENHGFETRTTCAVHAWISKQSTTPSFPSGVIGNPV